MIAYFFPPLGGAGVYRPLKFCKYLPAWDWKPVVLTADDRQQGLRDETLLADVPPQTTVCRIPSVKSWHTKVSDRLAGRRLMWRVGAMIRNVFAVPDDMKSWVQPAYRMGLKILQSGGADVIYSTSHPFSTHMVAMRLKKATGIPWVADFRDPWSDGAGHMAGLPDWVVARHFRLEHQVAVSADHITFAHPLSASAFPKRHAISGRKVSCITNGFDPDDFRDWTYVPSKRRRIHIVHLGTFYGPYSPAPMKRALLEACKKHQDLLGRIKLIFVGGSPIKFDEIPGIETEVLPRLSHGEALERLRDADISLNVYERSVGKHNISGKLYEYLAAGRPVLAIVPGDGTTAEIVRACRAGFVADPDDVDGIMAALSECINATMGYTPFRSNGEEIQKYSRHALAGRLAKIFAEVCVRHGKDTNLGLSGD